MKNKIFAVGAASLLLLSGCSKPDNNVTTGDTRPAINAQPIDLSSAKALDQDAKDGDVVYGVYNSEYRNGPDHLEFPNFAACAQGITAIKSIVHVGEGAYYTCIRKRDGSALKL